MPPRRTPDRADVPRDDAYLSLQSLAVYADVSVRTLRNYLADATNPLPHYKMHGKILVKRSEFDAWMRTFRVEHEDVGAAIDDVLEALR